MAMRTSNAILLGVALVLGLWLFKPRKAGVELEPDLEFLLSQGPVSKAEALKTMMYSDLMMHTGGRYGIEPALIAAMVSVESSADFDAEGDKDWRGRAQSFGLMQVKLTTAQQMGFTGSAEELKRPETNIDVGTRYLAYQYGIWKSIAKAVAAYNKGTVEVYASGQFKNQGYVDKVGDRLRFFRPIFRLYYPGYDREAVVNYELGAFYLCPVCL